MTDEMPADYEPPPWTTVDLTMWGEDWQVEVEAVPVDKIVSATAYYRRLMAPPPKPKQPRRKAK